jgi:hypothetical protein
MKPWRSHKQYEIHKKWVASPEGKEYRRRQQEEDKRVQSDLWDKDIDSTAGTSHRANRGGGIDKRIRPLVSTMNRNGYYTLGSCGGHCDNKSSNNSKLSSKPFVTFRTTIPQERELQYNLKDVSGVRFDPRGTKNRGGTAHYSAITITARKRKNADVAINKVKSVFERR